MLVRPQQRFPLRTGPLRPPPQEGARPRAGGPRRGNLGGHRGKHRGRAGTLPVPAIRNELDDQDTHTDLDTTTDSSAGTATALDTTVDLSNGTNAAMETTAGTTDVDSSSTDGAQLMYHMKRDTIYCCLKRSTQRDFDGAYIQWRADVEEEWNGPLPNCYLPAGTNLENTQRFTFIYTGNGAGTLATTVGKLNMASTAEVSAEDGKREVRYILTEEEFRKIPDGADKIELTWVSRGCLPVKLPLYMVHVMDIDRVKPETWGANGFRVSCVSEYDKITETKLKIDDCRFTAIQKESHRQLAEHIKNKDHFSSPLGPGQVLCLEVEPEATQNLTATVKCLVDGTNVRQTRVLISHLVILKY